ncbi:endonuclease YncB(thermonuclease family) [Bradyrhizobium diazoefficiens]|jgi:endonuclease YncB( thermonuclease family)|uniref:thermonuclease family protein n=1 Tax=Bradyrhizobium TaxID=374 RepID=UPI00272CEBB8|nr:thermonuclease family protein [Bradyrhizobium diazoefficiens]WLA56094.1 thermonuclease family protein [Bradyrhizobium diazoefficiens]
MPVGLLEVEGTIEVSQFWPEGRSDADTTKVVVNVAPDAIRFRKNDTSPFQPTHVFDNAKVKGRTNTAPIKNGKLTVRLQGIDAPELHYQPSPLSPAEKKGLTDAKRQAYHEVTHPYRQFLGATSSKALHDFLSRAGGATLACRVFTRVDAPNEVFDTYGRLVGDIEVTVAKQTVDINHWLVEQGFAYPTFYSSMNDDEIKAFLVLAKAARTKKLPVWKHLAKTVPAFDFDLREPKKNETDVLATDKGPVILPKLYRRQTNWSARKKAKVTSQTFQKFLGEGSGGKPDTCYEIDDFLTNGVHSATPRNFAEFVEGGKVIKFQPEGLVFGEAPSMLVGADNKPILHF